MGNGCTTSQKAVQTAEAPTLPSIKIVLIGESASGKTSIVARYEKNHFLDVYEPTKTVSIVSVVKKVNIPDQGIATVILWDVPDHEDVDVRKTYYLNADAVVVVVDISDPDALDAALSWKQDAATSIRHTKHCNTFPAALNSTTEVPRSEQFKPKPGTVPFVLLGNKYDIAKEHFLREHYPMYDGLSSKVTFDLEAKGGALNGNTGLPLVEHTVLGDASDNQPSLLRQSDEATSPPSKLDKSNDNDADQGIVVDANGEEDAEPAKTARVERSAPDEDQGIVADKEDTPSNSVEFHPTDAERRQESDVTINGDANPEIAENNAPPSTTTADVAKTDVSSGDTAAADVVRDNMEVSSDQTHAPDFDNTQKKSSDSGVEIKEAHDDLDEVTAVVNKSADEDNATDHIGRAKHVKLKKLFPKDLAAQIAHENYRNDVLDQSPRAEHVKTAARKDEAPATNEGSVVTMATFSTLPPCVDTLEKFAEENGFIAGIPVSAKDSKGGVHEALQSLVRHLVAKMKEGNADHRPDDASVRSQLTVAKRVRRKPRIPDGVAFEPLQEVGLVEIDETLRRCNGALRQAEELTTGYRSAMHDFKRACRKENLVAGTSVSIEECVSALKQAVESPPKASNERSEIRAALLTQGACPSFSLIARDDRDFIMLQVVNSNNEVVDADEEEREKLLISKSALTVLGVYQEKMYASCCAVCESSQELEQVLSQFCDRIASQEEMAWDVAVAAGHSQSKVRHMLASLAQGKARVRGTLEQLKDTRRSVNGTRARIRAALLF